MVRVAEPPTVVVEVKGPGRSREAIRMAAREARYRGAALLAVMAYSPDPALSAPAERPEDLMHNPGEEQAAATSALRETVTEALGDQAGQVAMRAVPGLGGRILVDTVRKVNADLLVLSGRDNGTITSGTVSVYLLHQAPCPVLIVPQSPPPR